MLQDNHHNLLNPLIHVFLLLADPIPNAEPLATNQLALVDPISLDRHLTAGLNASSTQTVLLPWLVSPKNAEILVQVLAVSMQNAEFKITFPYVLA